MTDDLDQLGNTPEAQEDALFDRVAEILEAARSHVTRTVNTTMVQAYWLIGREIVEIDQGGEARAGCGDGKLTHQDLGQMQQSRRCVSQASMATPR